MKDKKKGLNSTKMDERGKTPDRKKKIPEGARGLLFSKTSRPALVPTQPPVQLVSWFFPAGNAVGA
jgi:hypothetical protein